MNPGVLGQGFQDREATQASEVVQFLFGSSKFYTTRFRNSFWSRNNAAVSAALKRMSYRADSE